MSSETLNNNNENTNEIDITKMAQNLRNAKVRLVGKVIDQELIVNKAKIEIENSHGAAKAHKIVEKYLNKK